MGALVVVLIAAAVGAAVGAWLARRGITADNALVGRQRAAYAVVLLVAAAAALVYWAADIPWLPVWVDLVFNHYGMDAGRAFAGFAFGLVVALEWPGRRVPRRLANLAGGGLLLGAGAGYMCYRAMPVAGALGRPALVQNVVMQTTAYTCVPAAIATLLRVTARDTAATESLAVAASRTTREGTSTLAEMRAMSALGLAPRYGRRLTADSLVAIGRPAVLHVDEPVLSITIRHAVALIGLDPVRREVRLGNPLHGPQTLRFDQLKGYWLGEAVFVTNAPLPR